MNNQDVRVVIRVDGSHKIGMGHVYRSIAIADVFLDVTDDITFLMKNYPVAVNKVRGGGYRIKRLPIDNGFDKEFSFLDKTRPDVIIADKFDTKLGYMTRLKRYTKVLVTIDDYGAGQKIADIVVNSLHESRNLVIRNKGNVKLMGPKYLILSPKFSKFHKKRKRIRKRAEKILVIQGGADTYNFITKQLKVLDKIGERLHMTTIIGPAYKNKKELIGTLHHIKNKIDVKSNVEDIERYFIDTDIAISAGGTTLTQLACLGVPTIVICQEKKELITADFFDKQNAMINLGYWKYFSERGLIQAVENLLKDRDKRKDMSRKCKSIVDGKGAERVFKEIIKMLK